MKQDLTQGSLWKKILLFGYPLMISNILQVLFNLSDIAVVGRFAGSNALGSVGSTATLVNLYLVFLIGMGSGVNVLVARFFGSKNERDVRETVHSAALICLITGIVAMLFGYLTVRPILTLLHTKEELIGGAIRYMNIYFLGMPALAVYNFGNGVFSAVGDTKKPLYYLSAAGIVNVVLNLFFVIVCHLDVAGVAIASVIAQYISAVLIIRALLRSKEMYRLQLTELKISKNKARMILSIGISSGFQSAVFQIANLFIQAGVNSFSAPFVAGNAAAANADALVYDVMGAFYIACSSFIGQNYGAGKKKRVKDTYLICLLYSFGAGAVLGTLLVVFGHGFLSLFTGDTAVIEAGMYRLMIMSYSYAFSAFMDCTIAASRGLGKVLVPTIIVIMGSCVFRVIWIYTIFAYFRTIQSLYLLYIFSWSLTAIAEIIYFIVIYRKCNFGLQLETK